MKTIRGTVLKAEDTTPEGLLDSPRRLLYEIQVEEGTPVKVTYTAYPPSPAGDRAGKKITLDFHAGSIREGDYLVAHGSYDEEANTLTVAGEGDYIKTFPDKSAADADG
ncbi:hypothetical protein [Fodinibius sediminis]|uniref:Uncharacterized protein n=1 Tax=Fodinibius sediminis TaxID=1214077 RepID=A0A521CGE9_9BACT|nr:hypothetical protein [Fodinibius sediminis]SMO58517.1 hypothetical protein SAMN06265218_10659 [Fodinibius sediminis]